jgi:riboflavin-specific deaminase-like protein
MKTLISKPKVMRPFVYLNVATTVDGKLAPANRHFVPFSSPRDQKLLLELRTEADAVMAGARTVDTGPVDLGPGGPRYRQMRRRNGLNEYNLRVIVTGSGTLNPRAKIFQHRFSPILILTTARISRPRRKVLEKLATEVKICGEQEIDFPAALHWLRVQWNVRRLLCEGGGEVNGALFRAGVVDEVYWTISPIVFGGRDAPTMADGRGVEIKEEGTRLRLRSLKRVGDELFLVYRAVRRR